MNLMELLNNIQVKDWETEKFISVSYFFPEFCILFTMGKIRIKDIKLENVFRNIICNIVIFVMVFGMIFAGKRINDGSMISVSNSEYKGTLYAGDRSSKKISLMINVYWGDEFVEQFLDIFDKYGIKTTFFVGGTWVSSNPELLKKIFDKGHEIGSHGYSHKEQGKLGYETNYEEISKCHSLVSKTIGINMELFAPPGGSYNANTVKAASDLGYKTIMWTRDTIDWRDHDADLIYNRAVTSMHGGDLILMHPTACTVQAIEKVIEFAIAHELTVTTVSDVLDLKC